MSAEQSTGRGVDVLSERDVSGESRERHRRDTGEPAIITCLPLSDC